MSDGEGPFNQLLLSHGVVKALAHAIGILDANLCRQAIAPATEMVLSFLVDRFRQSSGTRAIVQALDGGLLMVFLRLKAKDTRTGACWAFLQELLQKHLPRSLVYYRAARQMKISFPDAFPFANTTAFTKSYIFPLWTDFAKVTQQRLDALDFFESKVRTSSKACENMQVPSAPLAEGCSLTRFST